MNNNEEVEILYGSSNKVVIKKGENSIVLNHLDLAFIVESAIRNKEVVVNVTSAR